MLMLKRKAHQSIHVNENIIVTVMEIRKSYVVLGVKAPKEMEITRPDVPAKPKT